jgi:hypothetical protein
VTERTIRASALNLARHCSGAHALARRHDVTTPYLERGIKLHKQIQDTLETGVEPPEELEPFFRWLRERIPDAINHAADRRFEVELGASWGAMSITGHADLIIRGEAGELLVVDWKGGRGDHLPRVGEDWQMLAYVAMASTEETPIAQVCRVMVDELHVDHLAIEGEELPILRAAVAELAGGATENADTRTIGPHCDRCLVRRHCPERVEQAGNFEAALAPSRGQGLQTEADALRLLQSLGPVKEAIEFAEEALRRFVRLNDPISDGNGRTWGPARTHRDNPVDHHGLVLELAQKLNQLEGRAPTDDEGMRKAWGLLSVRKGDADALLKKAGASKVQIRDFWNWQRAAGRVHEAIGEQWRWRNARKS